MIVTSVLRVKNSQKHDFQSITQKNPFKNWKYFISDQPTIVFYWKAGETKATFF